MFSGDSIAFDDRRQKLLFLKYQAYNKGISPIEFDKISVEDVFMFSDLEDAECEKDKRLKKRDALINTLGKI